MVGLRSGLARADTADHRGPDFVRAIPDGTPGLVIHV